METQFTGPLLPEVPEVVQVPLVDIGKLMQAAHDATGALKELNQKFDKLEAKVETHGLDIKQTAFVVGCISEVVTEHHQKLADLKNQVNVPESEDADVVNVAETEAEVVNVKPSKYKMLSVPIKLDKLPLIDRIAASKRMTRATLVRKALDAFCGFGGEIALEEQQPHGACAVSKSRRQRGTKFEDIKLLSITGKPMTDAEFREEEEREHWFIHHSTAYRSYYGISKPDVPYHSHDLLF